MNKRVLLVLTILVVGIGAVASFAVTQTSATVGVDITPGGSSSFMEVMAFGTYTGEKHHNQLPSWTPIEGTAGGIIDKGDLYFFEPGTTLVDGIAFVYLTNVGDLANSYSFLNMGLNLWKWDPATDLYTETNQLTLSDQWLTLSNGYVSFLIETTGVVTYVLTLDEVSWFCTDGDPVAGESLSPSFYVDVIQK